MCTVSIIPANGRIFITHNRDESVTRSRATAPEIHNINGHVLLFPKESTAGGTWIAVNKNGQAGALLNGAFIKHQHLPPYRMSRGLVMLNIMSSNDIAARYEEISLEGIEPFTVVLWNGAGLYDCRWDGMVKHIKTLDVDKAHTWSSVTLYDDVVLSKRSIWFEDWKKQHDAPSIADIMQYHLTGGDGDVQNDLRMNRNGQMLTVSITAIEIDQQDATMRYTDLYNDITTSHSLHFTKAPAIQS